MIEITETLDPALIDRFAAIVGDRYALRDQQDIAPYLIERRGLWHGATSLVLRPGSLDEVSRIMRLATETGTPIVPQSGNTGLVGAQVPDRSGREIVLSLSRLNRIREIDVLSNTVTVEAGVILQTLQEAADAADRLFPLSLAAQGSCQIGGNLSSNAGGTGVLAYGNARELCLGVEVVLPTGEVFDDLRKLKKDNTGYDLKNLFVGAEGTLGVITAAVLKLFPKPKGREVAFVGLSSPEAALSLFGLAMDRAGAALTAFELIGRRPYEFTLAHAQGVGRPLVGDWPGCVLVQLS
ncbi:FAD-binding oxidoreductase, partial [Mesorhizobium sp. M7A.F.Ca.US.014.04.1.1]|uniref:FAD-binding oxidoreductase n=1 Tax=Mesorhizobium sp. M7A.F.Ca.US.014.04.1.1 TaxID=2496744 RepID=UPI000FD4A986